MGIPPENNEYRALLSDLSTMYEGTVLLGQQQSRARVQVFWRMGRRIIDEVQKGRPNAAYGRQVLRKLSEDMRRKYGPGMGLRTLNYMRSFALHYCDDALKPEITWSHYRILLSVEDDERRKELEQRIVTEGLTRQALAKEVQSQQRATAVGERAFSLSPREARAGIYKVVEDVVAATRVALLDLGFHVLRREKLAERGFAGGTYVTRKGKGGFTSVEIQPGQRYCYRGQVLDVIDGDTVRMRVELGFGCFVDEKMRLRGVDAAEIDTKEGQKAKRALSRMLNGSREVTVYTYSNDRYGRYVADLITDGVYVNQRLVEKGYARFW
ncbi:MAG: thermonuclease family protein [Deltaproteobacteria bacterium]|nr:thermonuclease family protein [Deltaproteobacteria bacterium]MBN2670218.1 thermonuclease family protein [Deltaproteobacteria bacterium]